MGIYILNNSLAILLVPFLGWLSDKVTSNVGDEKVMA